MISTYAIRVQVMPGQNNSQVLAQLERKMQAFERQMARINAQSMAMGSGARGGLFSRMFTGIDAGLAKMEHFGKNLQWTGRQLQYTFTLPLLLAGAAAFKFALDNERAFTRLRKVYIANAGDTKEVTKELVLLRRAFVALSDIYGVQQQEVIRIGALWAETGAKGTALAKVVRLTLDTMILSEMAADDATKAILTLRAAYGLTADGLKKALAVLAVVANTTAVNYDQLIEAFTRSAASARAAGVDIRHLAAFISALVPATGTAETAGNAMKTIFSRLLAPTKQVADALHLVGIEVTSTGWNSLNGAQRLEKLADAYKKLTPAQQAVISSTISGRRQLNQFSQLMKDIIDPMGNYQKALRNTADSGQVFKIYNKEIQTYLTSQPKQLDILIQRLKNFLAQAILPALPAIFTLIRMIETLVQKFADLDPGTQKQIIFWVAMVAVLGPAVRILGGMILLFKTLAATMFLPVRAAKFLIDAFRKLFLGQDVKMFAQLGPKAAAAGRETATIFQENFVGAFEEASPIMAAAITGEVEAAGAEAAAAAGAAGVAVGEAFEAGIIAAIDAGVAAKSAAAVAEMGAVTTSMLAVAAPAGASVGAAFDGAIAAAIAGPGSSLIYLSAEGIFIGMAPPLALTAGTSGFAVGTAFDLAMAIGMRAESPLLVANVTSLVANMGAIAAAEAVTVGATVGTGFAAAFAAAMEAATVVDIPAAAAEGVALGTVLGTSVASGMTAAIVSMGSVGAVGAIEALSTVVVPQAALVGAEAGAALTAGVEAGIAGGTPLLIGVAIAAAVAAVTALAIIFRKQIGDAISWVMDAFSRLPGFIGDVLIDVLNVIVGIGKAIWQALSDALNPWQRHSPSLVDLVTSGVDVISAKYASLTNIGSVFRRAVADILAFKNATAGAVAAQRGQERSKQIATIAKTSPGAAGAAQAIYSDVDALTADLDRLSAAYARQQLIVDHLKAKLDSLGVTLDAEKLKLANLQFALNQTSKALNEAQSALDTWSSTPIEGMQAMSDAIFANEQATKGFQLQLLQLEDTYGTLDSMTNKLNAMNGQLELLRGQREALRLKGAGSDVLGPLNDQIASLEQGQNGVVGIIQQMQDLQDQIDTLNHKGQELDLMNSLQFDPLTRQIEQTSKAMEEMPFSVIIANVRKYRGEVDSLTVKYNNQSAAVEKQQGKVDALQHTYDNLQATYDAENAKLDKIGQLYDDVKSTIDALTGSLDAAAQAAQSLSDSLFKAGGKSSFKVPKPKAGDLFDKGSLDALVKQYEAEARKAFGKIDFGDMFTKPFKKAWDNLKSWFTGTALPWVGNAAKQIGLFLIKPWEFTIFVWMFQGAWHLLEGWWKKTAWPWLKKLPGHMLDALKASGNWFKKAFEWAWNGLKNWWDTTAMPWFRSLPGMIGQALLHLGDAIIQPFKDAWAYLGGGEGSIGFQIGHAAVEFALLPIKIMMALGSLAIRLVRWVADGFHKLVEALPGFFRAVLHWFTRVLPKIKDAIGSLGGLLWRWAVAGFNYLRDHLPQAVSSVMSWFGGLPGRVVRAVVAVGKGGLSLGEQLIGWIRTAAAGLWAALPYLFGGVFDFFKKLPSAFVQVLANLGQQLIDAFRGGWEAFKKWWNDNIASLNIHIPGIPHTPFHGIDLHPPHLALGGVVPAVAGGMQALIGEAGRAEMVAPLPSGFSMGSMMATLDKLERYVNRQGETTTMAHAVTYNDNHKTITFNGDLSFPNITSPDDADKFIRNLEALV